MFPMCEWTAAMVLTWHFVRLCESVECNGQPEEKSASLQSSADQEVPHPDVLPEQSTGDFDFNEFFNLEKTMPGLASVSIGMHRGVLMQLHLIIFFPPFWARMMSSMR